MFSAQCVGGQVTIFNRPVPGPIILSEGTGASSGIVLVEDGDATYIPKITPDLKSSIEKTIAAVDDIAASIQQIATTLTAIGAGMTGPTTAPPATLATDVATLATKVASINATRALLNTLKGALR